MVGFIVFKVVGLLMPEETRHKSRVLKWSLKLIPLLIAVSVTVLVVPPIVSRIFYVPNWTRPLFFPESMFRPKTMV
jgi:hypothetical protein